MERRQKDSTIQKAFSPQVITFECGDHDPPFLEVVPENSCLYTFVVHTRLACPHGTSIGVECRVEGFHDLVAFQRISARTITVPRMGRAYLSVCDTIGLDVPGCDAGAAACLLGQG